MDSTKDQSCEPESLPSQVDECPVEELEEEWAALSCDCEGDFF